MVLIVFTHVRPKESVFWLVTRCAQQAAAWHVMLHDRLAFMPILHVAHAACYMMMFMMRSEGARLASGAGTFSLSKPRFRCR